MTTVVRGAGVGLTKREALVLSAGARPSRTLRPRWDYEAWRWGAGGPSHRTSAQATATFLCFHASDRGREGTGERRRLRDPSGRGPRTAKWGAGRTLGERATWLGTERGAFLRRGCRSPAGARPGAGRGRPKRLAWPQGRRGVRRRPWTCVLRALGEEHGGHPKASREEL